MALSIEMKKIRDEVMIAACKDANEGMRIPDVCRKHGISHSAFFRFKAKYGGLKSDEIVKVKAEAVHETMLKKKIIEQEKIIKALKGALKKKF